MCAALVSPDWLATGITAHNCPAVNTLDVSDLENCFSRYSRVFILSTIEAVMGSAFE